MLASTTIAAASLAAGVEDGAQTWPLTVGVRVAFSAERQQPASAIDIAILQRAQVVIRHPSYAVTVATQFGL